jgi:hypothetical protein
MFGVPFTGANELYKESCKAVFPAVKFEKLFVKPVSG